MGKALDILVEELDIFPPDALHTKAISKLHTILLP
jgi:hypothetical protein